MRPVQPAHTLYLTRSFRFGKQIAMVANMVLGHFKGETHKIKGTEPPEGEPKNQKDGRYAIIARTNASIFREAIRRHRTKKIGFVGGIQGYRFQTIEDAYWLFENQPNRITDPYIRSFLRFSGMKEYAQVVEDLELRSVCAVVEEYSHQIPDLVAKIRAAAVDTPTADVCLTKAHKAKGLEWDTVFLTDDYIALMGENGKPIDPRTKAPDEFNLV
jgi:F-box protein 18 (helicase)